MACRGRRLIERNRFCRNLPADDRHRKRFAAGNRDRLIDPEDNLGCGIFTAGPGHIGEVRRRGSGQYRGLHERHRFFHGHIRHHAVGFILAAQHGFAHLVGQQNLHGAVVDTGQHTSGNIDRDRGTVDPISLVERLTEGDWVARDQREFHGFPVLTGHVFQRRPALQQGRVIACQSEPVAGLPQRCRHDVTQTHHTLAFACRTQGEFTPICDAVLRNRNQRLCDLLIDLRVGETNRPGILNHHLHQAVRGGQRQTMADDRTAIGHGFLAHDRQNATGRFHGTGHGNLFTSQCLQQGDRRDHRGLRERKIAEDLLQGLTPGEADGADTTGVIENDETLEHVVDLIKAHIKDDVCISANGRFVFQIGHAACRKHDPLEIQLFGPDPGCNQQQGHNDQTKFMHHPSPCSSRLAS